MPEPTAEEQLALEYINLLRTNPSGEYARLTNPAIYGQIASAVSAFGVNLTVLQQQLAALTAVAPLAWNSNLAGAAQAHNAQMIAADTQSHQVAGEAGLGARVAAAGYNGSFIGENVYAFSQSAFYGHAGFVIDWGYDDVDFDAQGKLLPDYASRGDGMQDALGHRVNLVNGQFAEIGIAITAENDSKTSVGPYVTTEDLATRPGYAPQVLGVVIDDRDGDHFYDVGEGMGGVTITLSGGGKVYTTTSWASGGWQVAVPSGTYVVHFSGGGLNGTIDKAVTIGTQNVKLDAEASQAVVFDSPLVDDQYYWQRYPDVLRAGADPDLHYAAYGWKEGRDPDALFSTTGYLAVNSDVRTANINPLQHYDLYGWKDGRDPSAGFDTKLYLLHNPDVAAAGIDPLLHFLLFGQAEGRKAYEAIGTHILANGFDAQFYLLNNPDVAAAAVRAGGDAEAFAFQHYEIFGWKEGRDPNAWFDDKGYLAHNSDVAAAGVNPLDHYASFGWKEGRDPSAEFDTTGYLSHYADIAAAGVNPLTHYLQFGAYELRDTFGDGWLV